MFCIALFGTIAMLGFLAGVLVLPLGVLVPSVGLLGLVFGIILLWRTRQSGDTDGVRRYFRMITFVGVLSLGCGLGFSVAGVSYGTLAIPVFLASIIGLLVGLFVGALTAPQKPSSPSLRRSAP